LIKYQIAVLYKLIFIMKHETISRGAPYNIIGDADVELRLALFHRVTNPNCAVTRTRKT
jgi:hypothetical protein